MIDLSTTLANDQIVLRLPGPQDAPGVFAAVRESLADLQPWMSWAHESYSMEDTYTWIESLAPAWMRDVHYQFVIFDRVDGSVIGGSGLSHVNRVWRYANLGYWVRSSRRGGGLAAQAARLVAAFGFREVKLARAEIVVAVGNEASYRAAMKSGAQYEAVLRNRIILRGQPQDAWMFSFVPQDFDIPPNISSSSLMSNNS